MATTPYRIILAEPDSGIAEMFTESLIRHFNPYLTCVFNGTDLLDEVMMRRVDLIITELQLPGLHGRKLIRSLSEMTDVPVIVTATHPTIRDAAECVRMGAVDLLVKPFAIRQLLTRSQEAISMHRRSMRRRSRNRQVRALARRAIRQEKELTKRLNLVCKDLVAAHRHLVHRVLEQTAPTPAKPAGNSVG